MDDLHKDCPMRHENGNCTVIGGFCTAVNDPICEGLHSAYDSGYRAADLSAQQERENPKPMTNADRIRSMTDDELNELFNEIYNAGAEDAVAYEWGQRTNSFEWTMEWLKQSPKGE